ncbi:Catalyzes the first step in biosynthesis of glycosaminoglycan [Globodera pallida]|nr:Catalyzes the first step in biosynthesis of glycosaminoglycan [Globodera pallida]
MAMGIIPLGVNFFPTVLLLLIVAFILLLVDRKMSREFREFRYENWTFEDVISEGRLAKSAFDRIQSAACRVQLALFLRDAASKRHWPVEAVENSCKDFFDIADLYSPVGCFRDSPVDRLFGEFSFHLPTASQNRTKLCVQNCLRAGFAFAGIEFGGAQCFCGSSHAEKLFGNRTIDSATCADSSNCAAGNASDFCRAFNTIFVYRTGAKKVPYVDKPVKFQPFEPSGDGNGGTNGFASNSPSFAHDFRFSTFYYVHVDGRREFMLKEMLTVERALEAKGFSNFRVAKRRMATIWGGSALLDLFLWTVAETVGGPDPKWTQWDYVVNLSETDMPILSLEELEHNLDRNRGFSFLKSHGYNTGAFLQKQGIHFHFMQCEQRMWRVAERRNYPDNIRLDGGSDWVAVHRDLARFAVSDSVLSSQMRIFFSSVLLPLESFFHTLALNSAEFCRRIVHPNLRFTNWRRRQGCRCAPLKPVVDWCGCSPLALRAANDLGKIALNLSQAKMHFFGRKFDSAVDNAPIAFVERQSLRFRSNNTPPQSVVSSSHWLNVFSSHTPSDVPSGINAEFLTRFISLTARLVLPNNCNFQQLNDVHIYWEFATAPPQIVATFSFEFGHVHYESQALIDQKKSFPTFYPAYRSEVIHEKIRFRFNDAAGAIQFGVGFDQKEEIFRTYPPLLLTDSKFTLKWRWELLGAELVLHAPNGSIFQRVSVSPYDSISGTQFAHFEFDRLFGVPSGVWSATLHANVSQQQNYAKILSVSFPIFSSSVDGGRAWNDEQQQQQQQMVADFFSVRSVCIATKSATNAPAGAPFLNFANCLELPWSTLFPDDKSVFPPAVGQRVEDGWDRRRPSSSIQLNGGGRIRPKGVPPPSPEAVTDARKYVNEIRAIATELNAERLRFGPINPSALWASSFCAPVYEQKDLFEMHVFGLRFSGHSIPLHDHPRMYGFIRPLYGRIRISSFSWLEPEEEQRLMIAERKQNRTQQIKGSSAAGVIRRPVRYAGDLILDGACTNPPIAVVEPNTANIHSIEALEDGAAFFDLLVPGYNNNRSCNYYNLSGDKAKFGIGDFVWLEGSEDVPQNFSMQQLEFDSFLMSSSARFE